MKNNYRVKYLSKRVLALLLSGSLVFIPGCQMQYKNKYIAENTLPNEDSLDFSFEDTYDVINQDKVGIQEFYRKYIRLFYDPEIGEKRIYSFYEADDYIYTIPDGELEMVLLNYDFANHYWDPEHYAYLKEHSVKLDTELEKYIGKYIIKDSYEVDELNSLLDRYVEGFQIIENTKEEIKKH